MNTNKPYTPSETRRKKDERYSDAFGRVMNNFHMHFPVGNYPHDHTKHSMTPEGEYRSTVKNLGGWDITYQARWGDKAKNKKEKRINMTGAEFYREIDRTVEKLGIPMTRVSEAINRLFWDNPDHDYKKCEELFKILWKTLLPVFIALRKKGFKQSELKN